MTSVATPGLILPSIPPLLLPPAYATALLIDATGEKIAFLGRFWHKDGVAKNITRVGFQFGAVTKAGGSGLTVSLQDVSLTANPVQPDEAQDQTVAIATGDAAFATNTWCRTAALSAARAVTPGDLLAVVIEYDGGGRLGADSVIVRGLSTSGSTRLDVDGVPSLKTGGTWASQSSIGNGVVLECDDGTFGALGLAGIMGDVPSSAVTATSFNSGSAADELALRFTPTIKCKCDGGWIYFQTGTSAANFDVVLYQGTTALATQSFDASASYATGSVAVIEFHFPPVSLSAGVEYFLAVKPTTANGVSVFDFTVSDANHLQSLWGGTEWHFASRVDGGSWTKVTTRRMFAGISLSHADDGTGNTKMLVNSAELVG